MADVLVMDCGGGDIKASLATAAAPTVVPNCTAKSRSERKFYVADAIAQCQDLPSLYLSRPFSTGYLGQWHVEKDVWERLFDKAVLNIKPSETTLLISEPPLNPSDIRDTMDEFVFEEFGFRAYRMQDAASLCAAAHIYEFPSSLFAATRTGVVVDSGFSFTHVIPFVNGVPQWRAAKRINVGGKLLSNVLKEEISYRQWNVMDESILVNLVKERLCFVSLDYDNELKSCRGGGGGGGGGGLKREYVLPSGAKDPLGHVKEPHENLSADAQVLVMNQERISIPELLFHPENIGIDQAGVAETILQSVESLPTSLHPLLFSSVSLVGGNARLNNYQQRVFNELRPLVADDYPVNVYQTTSRPDWEAWRGGCVVAQSPLLPSFLVTKQEYEEKGGHLACRQKFAKPILI